MSERHEEQNFASEQALLHLQQAAPGLPTCLLLGGRHRLRCWWGMGRAATGLLLGAEVATWPKTRIKSDKSLEKSLEKSLKTSFFHFFSFLLNVLFRLLRTSLLFGSTEVLGAVSKRQGPRRTPTALSPRNPLQARAMARESMPSQ